MGPRTWKEQGITIGDRSILIVIPNGRSPMEDPPGCTVGVYPEERPYEVWATEAGSTTETTTQTPTTTTAPPMKCSWSGADPADCQYWGFIRSVDSSSMTMVFDLARFEYFGEEEYEYELVNTNPLLRTLEIADDVAVFACPPSPGESVPYLYCNNIEDYYEVFTVHDLRAWVDNGAEFWGLLLDGEEVVHIEQWWQP